MEHVVVMETFRDESLDCGWVIEIVEQKPLGIIDVSYVDMWSCEEV